VPVKSLRRFLDAAETERVGVSYAKEKGSSKLESGSFVASVAADPASDFPIFPVRSAEGSAEIAASALRSRLDRLSHFASEDTTRPHMNAVNIYAKPLTYEGVDYRFAATNGHRVVLLPDCFAAAPNADVLLSLVAAKRFAKIAKRENGTPLSISQDKSIVSLQWGARTVTARRIEASFPPIEQVIPRPDSRRLTIRLDAERLVKALVRVQKVSEATGVRLDLCARESGKLTVRSEGSADCSDAVEASFTEHDLSEGESRISAIRVNIGYLCDAVTGFDGEVRMHLHDEEKSLIVLEVGQELHVIMPMRL
jgi:DNA polymerase III sliding clamp (beta) subunit (PCNA family)